MLNLIMSELLIHHYNQKVGSVHEVFVPISAPKNWFIGHLLFLAITQNDINTS